MAQKSAKKTKIIKTELFPKLNLSRKALKQLEAAEPSYEALERIKNLVKLKVVDGATCGF